MDPSFLTLLDEPCCPVRVLAHRAQWGWRLRLGGLGLGLGLGRRRGLGLGLRGLGLGGDRSLGLGGLGLGGLGFADLLGLDCLLPMAAAAALLDGALGLQGLGPHAIARGAAPLAALLLRPLRHVQRFGEPLHVEALAPFRFGPACFLAVVGGEDVLADAGV